MHQLIFSMYGTFQTFESARADEVDIEQEECSQTRRSRLVQLEQRLGLERTNSYKLAASLGLIGLGAFGAAALFTTQMVVDDEVRVVPMISLIAKIACGLTGCSLFGLSVHTKLRRRFNTENSESLKYFENGYQIIE